jgi:plasmid stability protein
MVCMPTLQIRNVPDDVHRRLKSRAALAGMSLSEFALAELVRSLQRPTRDELRERIKHRQAVNLGGRVAEVIRRDRDSR